MKEKIPHIMNMLLQKIIICLLWFLCFPISLIAQQTIFEKSNGKETATYFEVVQFYKNLDKYSSKIIMKEMGPTDAGYPLHLVLISSSEKPDPNVWHKQNKVVLLINNGIHPGEPDGIDACMMLVRDIHERRIILPDNIALALIPVYNIGGCLNRNSYSRVNQNGPLEYGFRGNSQNLDLNRDFTKCDSKEAKSFTRIFHYLQPDIFIDNHVSDGADYQHTMTLITTQYNKLGSSLGAWLKKEFEPQLYKGMSEKGWHMIPYLQFENVTAEKSVQQFYDPPRYSSGFAALFQTLSFVPETHMLKPFKERVKSTYDLMLTFIQQASIYAKQIKSIRQKAIEEVKNKKEFTLSWKADTTQYSNIFFKGYEQRYKSSEATGMQTMYFDQQKPFTTQLKFYDSYSPIDTVSKPQAYIIPQGWHSVTGLLKINNVVMNPLKKDSVIETEVYHIDDYKSYSTPYEKHHKNYNIKVSSSNQKIKFLKGDFIIPMNQRANRYIIEMLEPTGDDSFFAWNFFDAILQQKEYYSDYRWENIASEILKKDPELKQRLAAKKQTDSTFANNSAAQLEFIYKNSLYYEPVHLRYPVYRILK